jgi:hypothetical protein
LRGGGREGVIVGGGSGGKEARGAMELTVGSVRRHKGMRLIAVAKAYLRQNLGTLDSG